MKNPFLFFFRSRDKPTDTISAAPTFYFGSSTAGKSVTAKTAIQMSTVYACVRVIAETIASLPLHVYQADGQGSKKALEHPLYRMIVDLPFLATTGASLNKTGGNKINRRFSVCASEQELASLYQDALREAWRVLSPGGVLVMKCQDKVSSGKQYMMRHPVSHKADLGY